MSPTAGAVTGGNTVTVRGRNLTRATKVVFGTSVATKVRVRSASLLTAVVPKHLTGVVHVRVTTPAGQSATTSADRYTYAPRPGVTALVLPKGSVKGSTVTIRGTGLAGANRVLFGGVAAKVRSASSTAVVVAAPAHAAGKVNVAVTTRYGTSPASTKSSYEYVSGPSAVTNLKAAWHGTSVALTWTNPSNVSALVVRKAIGATPPRTLADGTDVAISGTPSGVVDTVEEFEPVSYSVFARTYTSQGTAQYSGAVSVAASAPGRATDLTSEATPGRLTFSWRNPAGVHHAIVSTDPSTAVTPRAGATGGTNIGTAQTYTATGLSPRSTYTFWITLLDAAGNYAGVSRVQGHTEDGDDVGPEPVVDVQATARPTSVVLTWSAPPDGDREGVMVSRAEGTAPPSTPTTPWLVGQIGGYSATTITDGAVTPGRTYTYGLWAYDQSGNYSVRAAITTTAPAGSPPGALTGVTATALPPNVAGRDQAIDLQWTNPADAVATVLVRAEGTTAPATIGDGVAYTLSAPASEFVDSGLAAGTRYSYSLWAVAADGTTSPVTTTAATTDPNTPRPVTGTIRNSVTKQPVASVRLRFVRDLVTVATATTDANGEYSTTVPVGEYHLYLEASDATGGGARHGYLDRSPDMVVTAAASTVYDTFVDPAVTVEGTVTDAITGKPLANVAVGIPGGFGQVLWRLRADTDANGHYEIDGLRTIGDAYEFDVVAQSDTPGAKHGYDRGVITFVAKTYGSTIAKDIALDPRPVVTVSGKLTNADDNSPVAGATIVPLVNGRYPYPRLTFTTSTDGSFTASAAATSRDEVQVCFDAERVTDYTNRCFGGGDYTVTTYGQVSLEGTVTGVRDGQDVSTKLYPKSVVTGTVRGTDGSPLAGVRVGADVYNREDPSYVTETGADGRYQIRTPIRPGLYDVEPVRICGTATPATTGGSSQASYHDGCSPRVQVSAANRAGTADIALAPTAGAAGRVTDLESGQPLGGVLVSLRTSNNNEPGRTFTAADGTWRVDDLDPADKPVTVCFDMDHYKGPGGALYPDQCAGLDDPEVIEPADGTLARVDAALYRSATVTGVLRGSDTGAPLAGVTMHLDDPVVGPTATTDDSGRYTFTGVPFDSEKNPHRVIAPQVRQGEFGYDAGDVSVATSAGATATADLTLTRAAVLDVEVVTQGGRPVTHASLTYSGYPDDRLEPGDVRTGSDGHGRVIGLPSLLANTRNLICASLGDGAGTGDQVGFGYRCVHLPTLRSARVATVTIVLPPARGRLVTTVYDSVTRQPVTDASITYFDDRNGAFGKYQSDAKTGTDGSATPLLLGVDPFDYDAYNPATGRKWRQCVVAPYFSTTCGSGGSTDGSAGPVYATVPGVDTAVQVPLRKSA